MKFKSHFKVLEISEILSRFAIHHLYERAMHINRVQSKGKQSNEQ
jgi:hypothetical protein